MDRVPVVSWVLNSLPNQWQNISRYQVNCYQEYNSTLYTYSLLPSKGKQNRVGY